MNFKYAIVQLPMTMAVIAIMLDTAPVDTPVIPCPRLHPPAITAPIPIMTLPPNTVRNCPTGGIFQENSLRILALKKAPSGTEKMK